MRSEGCSALLKSVRTNPLSAAELLDFSVRASHKPYPDTRAVLGGTTCSTLEEEWGLESHGHRLAVWPSPSSTWG